MTSLTAHAKTQSLYEKYLAFLSSNNPTGFVSDPHVGINDTTVSGVLLTVLMSETYELKALKYSAKKIRRLSDKSITHTQALELCALALGYSNYHELSKHHSGARDLIQNQRQGVTHGHGKLFDC